MPKVRYFPVQGSSAKNFSNDWGAARSGGRTHQGNDIFAAYGTPVVAVSDGVITQAGNDGGKGGIRIWLNGQFYYAHLSGLASGIKAGTRVKAGQVIGYVGDSGNAKGTSPHVHFGYVPSGTGMNWANPFALLSKLVNGGVVRLGRGGTDVEDDDFSGAQAGPPPEPERVMAMVPTGEPMLPTTPPLGEIAMPSQPGSVALGYNPRTRADSWDLIAQQAQASAETRAMAAAAKRQVI